MDSLRDNLRELARKVPGVWRGIFDTFVRDNRVLPPVVALLALFLFAWVVAGAFVDEQDGENADRADLVPSGVQEDSPPISPESEDRDADSFAAYRNKDPFRQLLAPASESTSGDAADDGTAEQTTAEDTTATPETTTGGGGNGGGGRSRADSDGDGVPNRREERLGLDPRNPDSDGDGTQDGDDDSDGDGVPDGQRRGGGNGGGANGGGGGGANGGGGGSGGAGGSGSGGNGDDLLDSGGTRGLR